MRACFLKNAALVLVAWAASLSALAHEFWIEPIPSAPAVGMPVQMTLRVGEFYTGELVAITTSHAVSLRVAMGALCVLTGATETLKVGCKPSDAPAGGLALTDGVRKTAGNYGSTFPYLTTPLPGNSNFAPAAGTTFP